MTTSWYETDNQGPTPVGRGLFMAGCAAFVWGAGTLALGLALADALWRRGRR